MLGVTIDGELERRLREAARRLGRAPDACVLAAVTAWVEDCEEAARNAARFGGGPVRPPDDFYD